MRTKDIVVVGLFSLLAAAGIYKLFDRSVKDRTRAPIAQEIRNDSGLLEAQIKQLEQQLAGVQQQMARQQLLAAGSAVAAAPSATAADPTLAPADAVAEQQRQQAEMDRVAADFEAEPRDANWSRDTTAAFQAHFDKGELLKNALQSLECRSSTCRLEMLDDRSPAFFNQLNHMAIKMGKSLPSMAGQRLTRPDGKAVFVYYFSKNS